MGSDNYNIHFASNLSMSVTQVDLSSLTGQPQEPLPKKKREKPQPLKIEYDPKYKCEIGVDEAGRGPLFGRLYVAAVVLPKDGSFQSDGIRDSKKITSKKKIVELSNYIKQHSLAWHIEFIESELIDQINIRQAVLKGMRECIRQCLCQIREKSDGDGDATKDVFLLIDGNDFPPYIQFDETTDTMQTVPHETIPAGDNTYVAIAAASILAKVARDAYIDDLCSKYPLLGQRYGIDTNMGYGTKKHLDGILEHGITQWHRKTYARCDTAKINPL